MDNAQALQWEGDAQDGRLGAHGQGARFGEEAVMQRRVRGSTGRVAMAGRRDAMHERRMMMAAGNEQLRVEVGLGAETLRRRRFGAAHGCVVAAAGWRDDRALRFPVLPSSLSTSSPSILSPGPFLAPLFLPRPPIPLFLSQARVACCQPSIMSGQQCLRRLAASAPLRCMPLLHASSRATQLSATATARSYSAVFRAPSSRLLGQASK